MKKKLLKNLLYSLTVIVVALLAVTAARAASGYIDPTNKWAWGTNIGWVNFSPTHGGVTVYDDHLEGYAWAENVGWIRLGTYDSGGAHTYANDAANTYGVNNDGAGNLSGYAWGTNIGWINFNPSHSQVTIDPSTGSFDGYAWAENVGWIHFKNTGANAYNVVVNSTLKILSSGVKAGEQAITDGGTVYGSFTKITVDFSKDVYNPALSNDPDDATNPDNYLLIQKGVDDSYNTASCNTGLTGDDIQIPVGPVSYSNNGGSGPFLATVTVNNGSELPVGEYRLYICGTTSIVDLNSVALAGDGVNSATDLILTFNTAEVASLPATGFPHGDLTALPKQPTAKAYTETAMTLEIPKLGVSMPIVGVPQTENGWDVTWLNQDAGYLAGSAFPTWAGNTVITAHVWDAYNNPGIFSKLKTLGYGDQVQIQAWDLTHTYEVRESKLVTTKNVGTVLQSEEYDWLTLVTCEFYNPFTGDYLFRRMVRAVLIDVR